MSQSKQSAVRLAVHEERLEEAFGHLKVLNDEHGKLCAKVDDIASKMVRIESTLDMNAKLTFVVLTVLVGQIVLRFFSLG